MVHKHLSYRPKNLHKIFLQHGRLVRLYRTSIQHTWCFGYSHGATAQTGIALFYVHSNHQMTALHLGAMFVSSSPI